MSDENEVTQQDENAEVYNDHSTDNSVHHAVNLWPLFLLGAVAAALIAAAQPFPGTTRMPQPPNTMRQPASAPCGTSPRGACLE